MPTVFPQSSGSVPTASHKVRADGNYNAIERGGAVDQDAVLAILHEAIVEGALLRIRPKIMTVSVIIAGLLPILFSQEAGADVMKRIAAPLAGGMISAAFLSLILIPVVYSLWYGKTLPDNK